MGKKAIAHGKQILKCILLIGFSIQIVLGIIWMCSDFAHVQEFGVPDSAVYSAFYRLVGEIPQVMYVLQLAAGFGSSYLLLQALFPVGKWFAIWRSMAVVTFPFAMQMALAAQPYSFLGSLFLMFLYFAVKKSGRIWQRTVGMLVSLALFLALSGAWDDADGTKVWDYGWEASLASRTGWYTMINDRNMWPEDLFQYTEGSWWETIFWPDNMVVMLDSLEKQVGEDATREYCLVMAEIACARRMPVIVRQIGWDVLGYALSPLIVPQQLAGEAYDSYTPGNYAAMLENAPKLTKLYVEYSCWWFGWMLLVSALLVLCDVRRLVGSRRAWLVGLVCVALSGVLVVLLTCRGAGMMDYRWTVAVNQLWMVAALLLVRNEQDLMC